MKEWEPCHRSAGPITWDEPFRPRRVPGYGEPVEVTSIDPDLETTWEQGDTDAVQAGQVGYSCGRAETSRDAAAEATAAA